MKQFRYYIFLLLSFSITSTFSQSKVTLDWNAKIKLSKTGDPTIVLTVKVDSSLYTVSMFQDTAENYVIPISVIMDKNQNIEFDGKWTEFPVAIKSMHRALQEGLYLRENTSYTSTLILKTKSDFTSIFTITYWALNEQLAYPPQELNFLLRQKDGELTVVKADK